MTKRRACAASMMKSKAAPMMCGAASSRLMADPIEDIAMNYAMEDECCYDILKLRENQKPALEELGETKEYCETNYFDKVDPQSRYQINNSDFWADYALNCASDKPKPFLNKDFVNVCNNFTGVMGVLSLLDLPPISLEHGFRTTEGRSAELKAASNLIIFKKEIKECPSDIRKDILVAQRYINSSNEKDDSKIEEFLVNQVYETSVIITNISSKKLDFDLLIQIPEGSLPVGPSPYQTSYPIALENYKTTSKSYKFYFPSPGKFKHFPANISIDSTVVAKATTEILNVVIEKSKISYENFREVVSTGDYDLIIKFLKEKPLDGIKEFSWNDLYWLLKDRKFFDMIVKLLKEQYRFEQIVWSYSIFHKHREDLVIEYLNYFEHIKKNCGYYFDSKLLSVRPINSGMWHLDYFPLVNPRAHKNIKSSTSEVQPMILNENLYQTYKRFILYLIEKPIWDLSDKVNLSYYLILQDRVTEAIAVFSKITEAEIKEKDNLKLQYDYMSAYLDFYSGAPEFKNARKIVASYLNYPVISWRLLFLDIDQQLKEYDGASIEESLEEEEERKERTQKKPIKEEPQLDISLVGKELVIGYNAMTEVKVKYYIIDLEILFSRTPFLAQNTDDFSFVQPNSSEIVKLDEKMREFRVKIPEIYSSKNVVIEVNGEGIQRIVTYFSTAMNVQIFENYGELKITDDKGKAISQVYVKAFTMKQDGTISFYKDGYTDIRGRFDFVSLNASQLAFVQKFSLFIMSEVHGSLIKECSPPSTTIRPDDSLGPIKTRLANYYNHQQKSK